MCGIIGIIGKAPVTPLLVEALKRLEYRGYDSAGVATLVNGHIDRRRAEGKLVNLEARLGVEPLSGTIGIGHTRRATPGKAMERLRGAFALVALFSGRHDILMGARRGSSLAVGYGDGVMYIGTDALALAPFTKRVTYLEEDDWVVLSAQGATIFQGREEVKREIRQSGISGAMMGKGN